LDYLVRVLFKEKLKHAIPVPSTGIVGNIVLFDIIVIECVVNNVVESISVKGKVVVVS